VTRPTDLPPADRFAHGTVARYVSGCRCEPCHGALRRREADRARRVREAAASVAPNPGPPRWKLTHRTSSAGLRYEFRVRICPGTGGAPCIAGGTWLRAGRPVCLRCADRAAVWNGLVDAGPVRAHLRRLGRQGVGPVSVAAACDVGKTVLTEILWGGKKLVRRRTADRVLAVTADAAADGGRIDARPTWKLIDELLEAGLTKMEIARRLGQSGPGLQLGPEKVLARTALAIRRLHARVMAESDGNRFVRDAADPRYVDAGEAVAIMRELAKAEIGPAAVARRLGVVALRFKARCTPGTLRKLRAILASVSRQADVDARAERFRRQEADEGAPGGAICTACGASHAPWERRTRLATICPPPGAGASPPARPRPAAHVDLPLPDGRGRP